MVSSVVLIAAAVNGSPLVNLTLGRSLNCHVFASSEVQLSASMGRISPVSLMRVKPGATWFRKCLSMTEKAKKGEGLTRSPGSPILNSSTGPMGASSGRPAGAALAVGVPAGWPALG